MYENYFLLKIAGNEQKFQNHQSKTEKRFGEYWIWAFDFHVFVIEFHHIQIFQIDTFSYFFYFFLCISSEFWWIGWKIQQSRLQYQITHCIVLCMHYDITHWIWFHRIIRESSEWKSLIFLIESSNAIISMNDW